MAQDTPIATLPYPELTDLPNAQDALENLATALDTQVVPRFASSAARGTAITSPIQGMLAYLTDTSAYETWTGSAWLTVANSASYGAWTSYTPTWTAATTNPTLGNGTLEGYHRKIGKTGYCSISLTFGSTTNAGTGAYSFGLPGGWSIIDSPRWQGSAAQRDTSSAVHSIGVCARVTASTVDIRAQGINQVTHSSPYTPAVDDWIRILLVVELT